MKLLEELKIKNRRIKQYRQEAIAALENRDIEQGMLLLQNAADLGDAESMTDLAVLYLTHSAKQIDWRASFLNTSQGLPVFPWDVRYVDRPDYPAAMKLLRNAAELQHPEAACMLGCMLYEGIGCVPDRDEGLCFLELAADHGSVNARNLLLQYRNRLHPVSDAEYDRLLQEFRERLEAADDACFPLYFRLRGGTEQQLYRLGYMLMIGKNAGLPHYDRFPVIVSGQGIPLIPAAPRRMCWRTYIRIQWECFPKPDAYLALASDILDEDRPDSLIDVRQHLRFVGKAVYRSPAFGWLQEEKTAVLLQYDPVRLTEWTQAVMQHTQLLKKNPLRPFECDDSVSYLFECGEKEYSVEITCICDGRVDILYRYTIGGSEKVRQYCPAELLSLSLEQDYVN